MMIEMKAMVQEEVRKEKEKLEEHVNSNFAFLEDSITNKIATAEKTQEDLNTLKQYTRKNSVRLFGVTEGDQESPEKEAIKIFKESLHIEVEEKEIEIAHRAGKFRQEGLRNPRKARPLLIKFLSHKTKSTIMQAKKEFKGTDFWLAEDLTRENAERVRILNGMRKENKIKSVWTIDGKIKVRKLNDSVVMINSRYDIGQL